MWFQRNWGLRLQGNLHREMYPGHPAELRCRKIVERLWLAWFILIFQVDYESKCRPVKKRICHATIPYGYLRGSIIAHTTSISLYYINHPSEFVFLVYLFIRYSFSNESESEQRKHHETNIKFSIIDIKEVLRWDSDKPGGKCMN